ncbi:MAG: 4-hydroxy-tetrahydrodipicolinate synthase [Bacillota bacterium]
MSSLFGPVVTAMVTPFDGQGVVNYKAAASLARYLAENGSTGLVVAGTTGEAPTLTAAEKLALFRVVSGAVKGKAAVIAGTGCNSTAASVELTRQAAPTGVDGVLLVTPYYNKPSQEGLVAHFKAVAASTALPVMIYNVPGRTGVNMTAETTLRLSEVENIVAVKEASGDLEQAAAIRSGASPDFALYCGDDALTLPMLSIGACGVVSVASNIIGPRVKKMVDSFNLGQAAAAALIHRELLPLFRGLFMVSNPVPVKAALGMIGFDAGLPRLPLLPLNPEQSARLKGLLARYELI